MDQVACRRYYSILNQNPDKFDVTGIVFEPFSPIEPWGANHKYNVDIRTGKAMVLNQVKGGITNIDSLTEFPFNARLFNYEDSPGNATIAQLSLGRFYLNYIVGLQRLFDHYRRTMSEKAAETLGVQSIVQTVFNSRTGVMSIWSEPNNKGDLIGFLRVFDGTEYKRLRQNPASWKEYYGPILPVEFSFQQRGITTSFFQKLRKEDRHIFEIGKFFIEEDLNPTNKKTVRKTLLRFLKEFYLNPDYLLFKDKVTFVIHVGSEVHQKAYQRAYGAKVLKDPDLERQLKPDEALLVVDLKTLSEKLSGI